MIDKNILDELPEKLELAESATQETVNAKDDYNKKCEFNRRKKYEQRLQIARMLEKENRHEIDEATFKSLYDYAVQQVLKNEMMDEPKPFVEILSLLETRLLPLKKKTDKNRIRYQRKLLGDEGVNIFKKSIDESYDRLVVYMRTEFLKSERMKTLDELTEVSQDSGLYDINGQMIPKSGI